MVADTDRTLGMSMIIGSGLIFIYYVFWVLVLPFVDSEHIVQKMYPSHIYALALPIILGVVGVFGLGIFIGFVMLKSKFKEKAS